MSTSKETLRLDVPGGTIAYDVEGTGPLVVCVPGMGDLRSTYRFLAPALVADGNRVVTTDLRGHGESSADFPEYGSEPTAPDLIALIERLGGPAVIIGNSMAAASAVLVAARRPDLVRGIVLVGPFVRSPAASRAKTLFLRALLATPWITAVWRAYLPSLYAGRRPVDFAAYRDSVTAALRTPGHARAFSLTARTDHDASERAIPAVTTPTLVVMGELDPDFAQPAVEARWIADALGGAVMMVAEAGHYPQAQRPDLVSPAIAEFVRSVAARG
jgi:pimeloyl-ACP methyl ester carboxylesterase